MLSGSRKHGRCLRQQFQGGCQRQRRFIGELDLYFGESFVAPLVFAFQPELDEFRDGFSGCVPDEVQAFRVSGELTKRWRNLTFEFPHHCCR